MHLISPDPGTQLVDKIISYLFILVFIWVVIEVLNNSLAWKILKKQIYAALRSFRREAGEVTATVEGVSSSAEQWSSPSALTVANTMPFQLPYLLSA
ncbi:hypothetical protein HN51_010106 [Arachis hypogaea]